MDKAELVLLLLSQPARNGLADGDRFNCEGQSYVRHTCKGPIELNEVIYTRSVFQKLPRRLKDYFFHEYNCSLCCQWFHQRHGHSTQFRQWFKEQVSYIYGGTEVLQWMTDAPLKIKRGR